MDIKKYISKNPIGKIKLDWDTTGYTSKSFNKYVQDKSFKGWKGDLPTDKEIKIIAKLLSIKKGDSLLDIACGYGRHSQAFAIQYNLDVTGIDISPGLIKKAKQNAQEKTLKISYKAMHGRDISRENCFNYAIIVFNSFSLFSPKDAPVVLNKIYRALKPGGTLFMDLDNKPYNCGYGIQDKNWEVFNSRILLQEVYFHKKISVEVNRDLYYDIDSKNIEDFVIFKRIYSKQDITNLLIQNKFKIAEIYGNWNLSDLKESSPKILLTAIKK